MTRLTELQSHGQSPWLDYIRRSLLSGGELKRLVEVDGVTGATTNPTIFEKAIAGSHDYDEAIKSMIASDPHVGAADMFERLAVEDVRNAADIFRPVWDRTDGTDGFVSIEVAPTLAHDTQGTITEARRLWTEVARPNIMIKVPGTKEGLPAIEQLLSEGINVNITLLFSLAQYEAVAQTYLRAVARARDSPKLASVASVFVSRIDSAVDKALSGSSSPEAPSLRGTVAIANSRLIYARFRELFPAATGSAPRVRPQRVLWASTSTKDPNFRDTLYVEELIGPETVDTLPPATMTAFEDHGKIEGDTLLRDVDEARQTLERLAKLGIDLGRITDDLQTEGVALFGGSYDSLLRTLETKKEALLADAVDPQSFVLGEYAGRVAARWESWQANDVGRRFWKRDPTFWPEAPPSDVATRLGWLDLPERMRDEAPRLAAFADKVRADGFRHVVVLGMGGSSLAPDVLGRMFAGVPGAPQLHVLDSTHPDAVAAMARRIDPAHTLFLVSSKSGTTTEPLAFYHFFREAVRASGAIPGPAFVAITDPGTPLEKLAKDHGFRDVFLAVSTVGGRYSALTMFGLVPAAVIGVDVPGLLDRAWTMAEACAATVPIAENPGLALGGVLGELARHGRDKLTFYASPGFQPFPIWVEQLVAESTGKIGKGIVPVVDEAPTSVDRYGPDRLFVEIQEAGKPDTALAAHTARLEAAGFPIVRIRVRESLDLGEEFFRWETAVASAGAIVGIDPFDQPDVELAKELARQAMARPAGTPGDADVTTLSPSDPENLRRAAGKWVESCRAGDYIGIQAYLAPTPETSAALDALRRRLLDRLRVATTFGYGPRFLHSTGQLHKGGPPSGMFLQLVDTPQHDLPVPGESFTFGQLIRAQSLGDYQALRQKQRRVLRVDLGTDLAGGLRLLTEVLDG